MHEFTLDSGSGVNFGVQHLPVPVVRGNRAIGLGETPDGEHVIHVDRIEP